MKLTYVLAALSIATASCAGSGPTEFSPSAEVTSSSTSADFTTIATTAVTTTLPDPEPLDSRCSPDSGDEESEPYEGTIQLQSEPAANDELLMLTIESPNEDDFINDFAYLECWDGTNWTKVRRLGFEVTEQAGTVAVVPDGDENVAGETIGLPFSGYLSVADVRSSPGAYRVTIGARESGEGTEIPIFLAGH